MGKGMDICLAVDASDASPHDRLEARFVRCLVCQAGIVLAGRKPAAVFGFRMPLDDAARCPTSMRRLLVKTLIWFYAWHLRRFGVRVSLLGWREGRAMLLVWRPRCVQSLLSAAGAHEFLAKNRLPSRCGALMGVLRRRLRAYYNDRTPFPHEIGFVLGYPIEDVDGFMSDGGQGARACGRWKVYGDVDEALRRFKELEREELRIKRLYSEGMPLRGLLRMATA
ncbi:hypothetical protein B5F79_00555 [Olsenella sp. An285]|uniref:DUF3793 family protein n=1 Tax=Olsenella sp. An285 TaxID=1965621 RepID=UPI000B3A003F|nr:DUF3793 family protein [Olsenella sp. An285]OUO48568.1 hypothetical protein B5F79_00555 [Olsenella sp. An285]